MFRAAQLQHYLDLNHDSGVANYEIGNEFIAGYGLDYDQVGRNLKDIYVVDNE